MERVDLHKRVTALLRKFKVVTLLGPRQSGKTTLARKITAKLPDFPAVQNYFDLEDPVHLGRLESPKLALEGLRGLRLRHRSPTPRRSELRRRLARR